VELTEYTWWGEPNEPPPHLKTKKQLGELGLSSLKPSGIIEPENTMCSSTIRLTLNPAGLKESHLPNNGKSLQQPSKSPNQDRAQMITREFIETRIHKDFGFLTYFFPTLLKQRRF